MTQSHVSRIETDGAVPHLLSLLRVAYALGVPLGDLLPPIEDILPVPPPPKPDQYQRPPGCLYNETAVRAHVGAAVRLIREQSGLTRSWFGAPLGLREAAMERLESGLRPVPVYLLDRLLRAQKLSVLDVLPPGVTACYLPRPPNRL